MADLSVVVIDTPTLGDRSYLVHDGEVAFVVDPQRDIDRVLTLLDEHGVRLTHVFETHIHNDYVTGGFALAEATGAAYVVNAADEVSFDRTPITDGETVEIGSRMRLTALATPGHTFTHLSYALADGDDRRSASSPAARCCTAPPGAPTCSGSSTPTTSSVTSTPRPTSWPTCSPTTPRCSRPTASGRSARPPSPRRRPRRSAARSRPTPSSRRTRRPMSASCSPGSAPGRPTTRTWRRPTAPARPRRT